MNFGALCDLLSEEDLAAIQVAPLIATGRFPTWYPIFNSEPRPVDYLSNQAVAAISDKGDDDWLRSLVPRLRQMDDPEEAAASLALSEQPQGRVRGTVRAIFRAVFGYGSFRP